MSRKLTIIIIVTLIVGILVFYMFKSSIKDYVAGLNGSNRGLDGCVKVPPGTPEFSGDMKADWGAYGPAKTKYLGIPKADLEGEQSQYVDGFFKAIDAEPNSKLVRKYSREIKAWLASGRADVHWMVERGELRCPEQVPTKADV